MAGVVRVGLVGAGGIARDRHVPGLRALEGVEITHLATRTPASAERAAAELGVERATADWRSVVDDPEVDAILVATWPDTHAEVTLAALAAGKHVLTEARMARDADEARRMLEASEAHADLVAMVVPSSFSLWADATIERLLGEGAIGELRTIRLAWSGGVYGVDPWRRQRERSGNNTMALGIVYEALMRWCGPARAVAAMAMTAEPEVELPDGERVAADVPDHLLVAIELEGPVLASLEMSATPRPEPPSATFFGTQGALRADFGDARLEQAGIEGGWREVPVPDDERRDWRAEADFIAAIRDGAPVELTDFRTGVRYMAFTDAVVAAIADGRRHVVAS